MLSVLVAWVLIGLVVASIGNRIVDATGGTLLRDMGIGATGAACGGAVLLMGLGGSTSSALAPVGLAASLLGALGAFVVWRVAMARRAG